MTLYWDVKPERVFTKVENLTVTINDNSVGRQGSMTDCPLEDTKYTLALKAKHFEVSLWTYIIVWQR